MPYCYITDNLNEIKDSLLKVDYFINQFNKKDMSSIKWLIITTHMAVQNTMVLYLSGTFAINTINEKCKVNGIKLKNCNTPYETAIFVANCKLNYFNELFEKVKDVDKIDCSTEEINNLNSNRNDFIHFKGNSGESITINDLADFKNYYLFIKELLESLPKYLALEENIDLVNSIIEKIGKNKISKTSN